MAIRVTRQLKGREKEVLCFVFGRGTFWKSLETEKSLGFPEARRFLTDHGARLASMSEGGAVETIAEPPVSALLQPQAC